MANEDIWARIDAAVVQTIQGLKLAGIGSRVYSLLWSDKRDVLFPCVMVTEEGEIEERVGGSTEDDDWVYPVRVFVADVGNSVHDKKALYLTWRKTILEAFDRKHLDGVTQVVGCTVIPSVVFDRQLPEYQHLVTGMVLRFRTCEPKE